MKRFLTFTSTFAASFVSCLIVASITGLLLEYLELPESREYYPLIHGATGAIIFHCIAGLAGLINIFAAAIGSLVMRMPVKLGVAFGVVVGFTSGLASLGWINLVQSAYPPVFITKSLGLICGLYLLVGGVGLVLFYRRNSPDTARDVLSSKLVLSIDFSLLVSQLVFSALRFRM